MGYFKNKGSSVKVTRTKETVESVSKLPIADLTHRGISKETTTKFNVRMSVSSEDGETPQAIYFPYYDQKNKLSGWKKKDLTLEKSDRYYITAIGKVGVNCKLFGQQLAETNDRPMKNVIIVEGEEDTLISYQALAEWADSTSKYVGMRPYVVGLNCGAANAVDSIHANGDFISKFGEIRLAFDNDSATEREKKKHIVRGKECTDNVASSLLSSDVVVLDWTKSNQKDPNDVYLEEGSEKLTKMLSFGWVKYQADKVVTASDIGFEAFTRKREEGVYVPTFPRLMEKIHGFRVRELTVITAPSGAGKSTTTAEIAYHLAEQGHKVGMIFLEEETDETLQRMGARYLEVNYNHFKKDPKSFADDERLKEAYDWCRDEDKFVFLDHFGSIPLEDLMKKINNFHYLYNVDFIILDHLSMLVTGLGTNDERSALEKTMVELAAYVASHDLGIIAVSHLNRNIVQDFRPPKGKENEPFWVNVRKEDLKGASGLEQLSWIVLGLEPEIMPDKSRGRVRWSVLKNRPWGYLGIADIFQMNDTTGLLENAEADF
ncbi:MAG: putative ATP-dependent helicase [Prokaryotic dsDNA virus sp.]|nr:MAG: putative ATP-dependent helicase [Prokaryotic dsDNA virus sp.]|tara:strand:+ start:789 stop:2426 length:1638 start_codon:yes stop_codon:yes gene_type:complete